jgi:hypothetical protein
MTVTEHNRAGVAPKPTSENLIGWAGLSAVIAGTCYVLVGIFHPANLASSVTTPRWEVVHVLACVVCFFGVLGVAGLYVRQAARAGWLGLAGCLMLELWMMLIMGFSFVEAFILPHLASATPALVQAWMGMFNGPAGRFDLGVLPTIWVLTAPIYILGGACFGIATFRAGILPRWAGALLALSTLLAPAAGVLPNAAQPKMAIPMGIALAGLGYALWTEQRTQPLASASREPATSV